MEIKKILAFNWKMNPNTSAEALDIAKASDSNGVIVFPPFPFIEEVGKSLKKADLGAQDLFWENPDKGGPFTGEVSAEELKGIGVSYAIVGHSERRRLGEKDDVIAKKMKIAIDSGIVPILCVGENGEEKKSGRTAEAIRRQLMAGLSLVKKGFLVAYEPVWAIGTGKPEAPDSAKETIKFIKKILVKLGYPKNIKVLYGGSVDSKILKNYIEYRDIDGVLVGGASLKKEEIKKMIKCLN